jgi:hypothetical protein
VETNNPISGLNVAENGAVDDQLLHQAQSLVRKMRDDRFIDFNNDWKVGPNTQKFSQNLYKSRH